MPINQMVRCSICYKRMHRVKWLHHAQKHMLNDKKNPKFIAVK